jgi:hypothetical protein
MIKIRGLSFDFSQKLDSYVQEKYLELLVAVERGKSNHIEE